jgi:hypothetical protein
LSTGDRCGVGDRAASPGGGAASVWRARSECRGGSYPFQVQGMPVGGAITVNLLDGHEYYGRIKSIESDSFSVHEVDLKQDLTFPYETVKKVRKGYGGKNSITGKRIPPRRRLITTLIVVGALLTLVFVAAASDKS